MKNNNWNILSRAICISLLGIAAFCSICGLGAAFSQIPWLMISAGICLALLISAGIWFLGYKSRQIHQPKEEVKDSEVITVEELPRTEKSEPVSYRVHRAKVFDYDVGEEVPSSESILDEAE